MGKASLSIGFALVLSLSFTSYSSSSSRLHFPFKPSQSISLPSKTSQSPSKRQKASAYDLLSILGTPQQSSAIDSKVARELKSCLKFIVPFTPNEFDSEFKRRSIVQRSKSPREGNRLIWWPPEPVLELARLAFDSGGDPAAVHRALDPAVLPVPDIEGSKEKRCELTRTPYGRRFINEELNSYLEFLFEFIAARGPIVGLNVSLSRYDFFHGHLFIAMESRRLGILFHAKEYPAYEKEVFPYNMGYCQIGSKVKFDDSMNLRNILWLAPLPSNSSRDWVAPGVLVVLDAHPGGIIYRDLIPEYVNFARTIYEDDFGEVVVDVNYLNVGGGAVSDHQIFIC